MKSRISEIQHNAVIEICRRMKPEERLVAFFNHSRLINEIHLAGTQFHTRKQNTLNRKDIHKNYES